MSSNSRIKSYFNFDPIELIDDIVCAVSQYINDGIESLAALLIQLDNNEETRNRVINKITELMQDSLNRNSDLFELYLMRNIFVIPVDVDLASAIDSAESDQSFDVSNNLSHENELDEEIENLYKKINEQKLVYLSHLKNIKENEIQSQIYEQIISRVPILEKLLLEYQELPQQKLDELVSLAEDCFNLSKNAKSINDSEHLLEFHKKSFNFD